ncbi:MAG: CBS domain-containing protein [Cyanobacteria bacterium J06621_11]
MPTVADIMSTEVFTIRSSAKVTQAIALMQSQGARSLVVERAVQGGAYGIVTERDIVYKVMAKSVDPLHMMVCEIMSNPCWTLDSTMSLLDAAVLFEDLGIQQAPVIDDGRLAGLVSIADIITKSDVEAVHLPNNWAQQVETALRHKRLCWGDACQLAEESEVALEVLSELQPELAETVSSHR